MSNPRPTPELTSTGTSSPTSGSPSTDALSLEVDGLRYDLDRPPTKSGGKRVVVMVRLASGGDGPGFADRADLYSFRSRSSLATAIADHFGKTTDVVMGQLAVLLDQAERASLVARKIETVVLTPARKAVAERLLGAANLLDRAATVFEDLGYVGETENKKLVYLVATSRLLGRPLSGILFAESATGKSDLLEKLMSLLPPEAVEFHSRLTQNALYYAGEALRHKLVVVDEQAGATEADYSVRTLQTRGSLRLALPGKPPVETPGPIALLSGTTRDDLNPENLSRCLELKLDDSVAQTRRVQEAQRRAWTGTKRKSVDVEPWQNAQRLLEAADVVVPYATKLAYPARTTRDRRNNAKLLTLVASHALLMQRQRERDSEDRVVASVDDYRVVHGLLTPLVQAEVDGLSPRAAALYRALAKSEKATVTRREASALMGAAYNTVKRALAELEANEIVRVTGHDMPRRYALVDGSLLGATVALTDPDRLR